jgi:aconitate hydratase
MGILPLQLPAEWRPETLGLLSGDTLEIPWNLAALAPRAAIDITLRRAASGDTFIGRATALVETTREVALLRAGGIIPMILARALPPSPSPTRDKER